LQEYVWLLHCFRKKTILPSGTPFKIFVASCPEPHPALTNPSIFKHSKTWPSSSFLLITLSKVRDLAWLHLLYRWMRYVQLVWTYRMSTLSWGNFLSEEKKVGHDLFRPDVITSRLKAMLPSKLFCHVDRWHTSCLLVIVNSIYFSVAAPII
jgi:hypothetical protein